MKLPINLFPPEIIKQYNLLPLVHDVNYVYMETQKGVCGLPQAGRLADDQLKTHLQNMDMFTATKRIDFGLTKL